MSYISKQHLAISKDCNQQHGPQYEVETRVEQVDEKWQVLGAKFLLAIKLDVVEGANLAVATRYSRKTWPKCYLLENHQSKQNTVIASIR